MARLDIDIDIIVPVFNALEDVRKCLASLEQHTDGFRVRTIVVNDGSDQATTDWLRARCKDSLFFELIEHDRNLGYTRTVNTGLIATAAECVILQNSDTIVSPGWLNGILRCMNSDPRIGIVGPLSNAASWQSIPDVFDASGRFAINELPPGLGVAEMAALVANASRRIYPRVPFVNGFCFAIRRGVIETIGYMDEQAFPVGYGEENDYCIRAQDAGFELAIADDAFVFHAKSKSFGHHNRDILSQQGSIALKRKHSESRCSALMTQVKKSAELAEVRARLRCLLARQITSADPKSLRILFLLPVRGGGGGSHSVVQEAHEMRRLGVDARVAVQEENLQNFIASYRDMPGIQDLFAAIDLRNPSKLAGGYDIVIGTIFTSMKLVKQICAAHPHIMPAYYVQDYEPLFFQQDSEKWQEARESYTLLQNACLFAKTEWIVNEVEANHAVKVHRVSPSIDHQIYKPKRRGPSPALRVTAMIRPQTPRRGPDRTMRLLSRLHQAFRSAIEIHVFGCSSDHPAFAALCRDFPFVNHGELLRGQVAELLAVSDLFIDLSDYQAFGRTALEAMACGCAAVVPLAGGASEYAEDGKTALVVDTANEEECFDKTSSILADPRRLLNLQRAAIRTAARYSVHAAAVSELLMLGEAFDTHRAAQRLKRDDTASSREASPPPEQRHDADHLQPSQHASRSGEAAAKGGIAAPAIGMLPGPSDHLPVLMPKTESLIGLGSMTMEEAVDEIQKSGDFDRDFYLSQYARLDPLLRLVDPISHYLAVGSARGWKPSRSFTAIGATHDGIGTSRLNPLLAHALRKTLRQKIAQTSSASTLIHSDSPEYRDLLSDHASLPHSARVRRVAVVCDGNPSGSFFIRILERCRNAPGRSLTFICMTPEATLAAGRLGMIDAVITARTVIPAQHVRALTDWLSKSGIPLIYDIDDDLLRVPPEKDPKGTYKAYEASFRLLLSAATMVTVSTEVLRETFAPLARRVELLPNRLSDRLWTGGPPTLRRADGLCRAVYMGTNTHDADLGMILPALDAVAARNGQFRCSLIGVTASRDLLAGREGWLSQVEIPAASRRYEEFVPWLIRQSPGFDFALAPLEDTYFNAAKSPLKLCDYAGMGLPVLASDVATYRRTAKSCPNVSLIANTTASWQRALAAQIRRGTRASGVDVAQHAWLREHGMLQGDLKRFDNLVNGTLPRQLPSRRKIA